MPIRETHALRGELVDVRRRNLAALGIVALHIAVAEIVGENHEDVGLMNFGGLKRGHCREQQDSEQWE